MLNNILNPITFEIVRKVQEDIRMPVLGAMPAGISDLFLAECEYPAGQLSDSRQLRLDPEFLPFKLTLIIVTRTRSTIPIIDPNRKSSNSTPDMNIRGDGEWQSTISRNLPGCDVPRGNIRIEPVIHG